MVKGQAFFFSQIATFYDCVICNHWVVTTRCAIKYPWWMRHQVPMVSLLPLLYLGAVAYISVEISLDSSWRRDILRVKGQALFTNCIFFSMTLCDMQSSSGNYSMRHHGVFTSFSLSKYWCLHFCRNKFGLLLAQEYLKGQRSSIIHKLQHFMNMQLSSGYYSMRDRVPTVF